MYYCTTYTYILFEIIRNSLNQLFENNELLIIFENQTCPKNILVLEQHVHNKLSLLLFYIYHKQSVAQLKNYEPTNLLLFKPNIWLLHEGK